MARYAKKTGNDPQLKGLDKAVAMVTRGSRIEDSDSSSRGSRPGSASAFARRASSGPTAALPEDNQVYSGWRSVFNPVYCFYGMIACVGILTVFGIIMVFSSSSVNLISGGFSPWRDASRQLVFALGGLLVGGVLILFANRFAGLLRILSVLALLGSWGLQALTMTSLGRSVNGNTGWLVLGPVQFQPAEVMKLALCLWMPFSVTQASARAAKVKGTWDKLLKYAPPFFSFLISFALIMFGKDLGTAMIITLICLTALYVGGFPLGPLATLTGLGAFAVGYFMVFGSANRRDRFSATYSGCTGGPNQFGCFQIVHGKYALASGGLLGKGLGGSLEKWNYLPEAKNDFIFAVIGEEMGYIGALGIILLFIILAWCMINIALRTRDCFSQTVILCVASWISFQAIINIGVVTSLLPVIGLPLPFISSGGSALVVTLTAMGVVIGLSRRQDEIKAATSRIRS